MRLLTMLTMLSIAHYQELSADEPPKIWTKSFDNLADYEVLISDRVRSDIQCQVVSCREASAQLATFDAATGLCRVFRCRLGLEHCRKCRSLQQRGNQAVWTTSTVCWTTLQHRVSDSVSFDRNLNDYKNNPFGEDENGNYWIGLKTLESLTRDTNRQLRILMKLWNVSEYWAQYSNFSVRSPNYYLNLNGFTASAGIGDAMSNSSSNVFIGRDGPPGTEKDCAKQYRGAWWFGFDCFFNAQLNGAYQNLPAALNSSGQGLIWSKPFGFNYSLMEVEMLIL